MKKYIGRVFVILLFVIISVIYYTFYCKIYFPLLQTEPEVKWVLVIGHFLLIMQLWCLLAVIFSKPGTVPPYWVDLI